MCSIPRTVSPMQKAICRTTFYSIKRRITQHLAKLRNNTPEPLYEHFQPNRCGLSNMRIQILETIEPHNNNRITERKLIERETLWIQQLMSGFPQGLNQIERDHTTRYKSYTYTPSYSNTHSALHLWHNTWLRHHHCTNFTSYLLPKEDHLHWIVRYHPTTKSTQHSFITHTHKEKL